MKSHKLISVGLGVLLLSGFFVGLAIAENDSLHVIMTVEDRHYAVGDTITVQVRVYDNGELVEPTNVTLGVSQHHEFNNPIMMNLTNEGTGIYYATYTVKANDNHHNLYFFYEVWSGQDNEIVDHHYDALVIDVYSVQDTVDVSFNGQEIVSARPGDVATATILVRTGDTPIPITGFDHLYVEDSDGNRQNLTYRTESTGIYLADYIIPDVVKTTTYEVYADPADVGDHDSAAIIVNVLDVWYHKLISGTTTSFELCVADMDGQPVAEANFWFQRNGWPNDIFTGTTNTSGKSLVHVTDVDGTESFTGYVLANGLNQTIQGAVINSVGDEPHHNDFDIVWEGSQTMFEVGRDISIPYGAYDGTVPVGDKTIYYYVEAVGTDFTMYSDNYGDHVESAREVVATGSVTTSPTGLFNLDFEAPDNQCALEIRFEVALPHGDFPNEEYDHDNSRYYDSWPENDWNTHGFVFYAYEGDLDGSGDVSISGGSFKPGSSGTVTVSMDSVTGNRIMAFWGVGEATIEDADSYDPEWLSWNPGGNIVMLQAIEGEKLEGSFHVPEFIEDQDVTVSIGYIDADGIPHFDSKTVSSGGLSNTLWLIIFIIIAVVAAVVMVYIKINHF